MEKRYAKNDLISGALLQSLPLLRRNLFHNPVPAMKNL
jgi:hypothetical protein